MKLPSNCHQGCGIYVEKDYWVTYALFTIFNNEIGKDTVFKGRNGTIQVLQYDRTLFGRY
jgi:predicted nucleotidyltransferase component of viral defense system